MRFKKTMAVLSSDANLTMVAMMTSRRRLAEDTSVSASPAEQVWATIFLVVIIVILLCLCLVCCSVFTKFAGCGSFLGRAVLACCPGWCGAGKKKRSATHKPPVSEARVVGPAPIIIEEEEEETKRPIPGLFFV